jgi:hypothetical protein
VVASRKDKNRPRSSFGLKRNDPAWEKWREARDGIARRSATKIGDEHGHFSRGRRGEQGADRQFDPEARTKTRDCCRCHERVASHVEKVVVRPKRRETKHLRPDFLDNLDGRPVISVGQRVGRRIHKCSGDGAGRGSNEIRGPLQLRRC